MKVLVLAVLMIFLLPSQAVAQIEAGSWEVAEDVDVEVLKLINQDSPKVKYLGELDGYVYLKVNQKLYVVNMDILAVDGNGEVISANPYISTDTEK